MVTGQIDTCIINAQLSSLPISFHKLKATLKHACVNLT